jgi:hypothetical protein
MKSYTLNIAGTGECIEFFADDDSHAESQARGMLVHDGYDDVVVCDQWDADGVNDDDEPCKRLLIWASEEDAENDAGAKSIAQIETIGDA